MELVGDILLNCVSGSAFPPNGYSPTTLSVSLNVDIANDVEADTNLTDAVVLVNENNCASPSPVGGTYDSCGAPDPRVQDPQLGVLAAANRIEWTSLDFPYPGAIVGDGSFFPYPTIVRITGIRANVMQLGVPSAAPPTTQVTAFVSLIGQGNVFTMNNVLNVAIPSSDTLSGPSDPSLVSLVSCSTAGIPLPVDPAGLTEQLGDLIIICSNLGTPPPQGSSVTLDIGLLLNTDVTNDDLPSPSPPELIINDGTPIPGVVDQSNRAVWRNVTFPVPQAPFPTRLRVRGVRADIASLFTGGETFPSTQVTGLLMMGLPLSGNVHNLGVPFEASSPAPVDGSGLVTCRMTSVLPVVRAEGVTEPMGDVVLVCESPNAPITAKTVTADIVLTLNANVTNNIGFGPGADLTDAVLIVNENNCPTPVGSGGVFGTCGAQDAGVQDPQYGKLEAPNRLSWRSVVLPVPGVSRPGGGFNPFPTTIRISSVRARASQFGIPDITTFPFIKVTAFLAIDAEAFAVNTNVVDVGVPITGLITTMPEAQSASQCVATERPLAITVREGFATSFKTTGTPAFQTGQAQWEVSYPAPGSNLGGGASQGTRLLLRLSGVPEGVRLSLPRVVETGDPVLTGDALQLRWVSGADETGAGGVVSADGADVLIDSPSGGVATVVYEVMDNDPYRNESATILASVSWDPTGPGGPPEAGAIQAQLLLAPVTTVLEASFPAPEPRFEAIGDPSTVLTINPCEPTVQPPALPAGGEGTEGTFTFTFSDPDGWQDLGVVNALINFWLDGRNACYLAYNRPLDVLYLVNDDGAGLSAPLELGAGGSVSNSQCTIFGSGSSASGSGNTLTLTLNMSFAPAFSGTKVVYLAARDALEHSSDWQRLGVWNVPGGAPTSPAVVSMSPRTGAGSGPTTFDFVFSDADGGHDLGVLNVLVNDWLDGRNACYLAYSRPDNQVYLVNDAGDGLLTPIQPGGGGSVSNSQCTVFGAGSSVSVNGDTLTLQLNMSFSGAFSGNRVFYVAARDLAENNSGWQAAGSWSVP